MCHFIYYGASPAVSTRVYAHIHVRSLRLTDLYNPSSPFLPIHHHPPLLFIHFLLRLHLLGVRPLEWNLEQTFVLWERCSGCHTFLAHPPPEVKGQSLEIVPYTQSPFIWSVCDLPTIRCILKRQTHHSGSCRKLY